jgi:hypothetical protein
MAAESRRSAAPGKRRKVDWEAVERDYRASQLTLRELGEKHGADPAAISRMAKKHGWSRDLMPAVRKATELGLIKATVERINGEVNKEVKDSQQQIVDSVLIAAEVNTQVILGHRKGLNRLNRIKEALLDQIEQAAQLMPELAEVIEMVRQPDDNGVDKANDALRKAMSRSSLVDDLKKLAEIDERVRKGEREAFNIGGTTDDEQNRKTKRVLLDFIDVEPRVQ